MKSSAIPYNSRIIVLYVLQQAGLYTAVAMFLTSLVLATFYLRDLIKLGIEKNVGGIILLKIFWLTQLAQLGLVLPIALFLGLVFALSGMQASREIMALRSLGMSFGQILRPFTKAALILLPVAILLHQLAMPWARGRFRELRQFIESYAPIDFEADGNTTFSLDLGGERWRHITFGKKTFDHVRMTHVFQTVKIVETQSIHNAAIIRKITFADNAYLVNRHKLRLSGGHMIDLAERKDYDWHAIFFPRGVLDLRLAPITAVAPESGQAKDATFLPSLIRKHHEFLTQKKLTDARDFEHEIHQRMALPFMLPILVVLAFMLCVSSPPTSRWRPLAIALPCIAGYYAIFILLKMAAVDSQALPIWLAAWLPNLYLALPTSLFAWRYFR